MRRGGSGKYAPFREKPLVRVSECFKNDDRRLPKIEVIEDDLLIHLKLCKAGYASSVSEAKEMDAREVLQALNYEMFLADYEETYLEINRNH